MDVLLMAGPESLGPCDNVIFLRGSAPLVSPVPAHHGIALNPEMANSSFSIGWVDIGIGRCWLAGVWDPKGLLASWLISQVGVG
jgi:hypothetical protein